MSKRTIIIAVVAVIAFIAALFSLFFEKQAEINTMQAVIDGPEEEETPLKVVKRPAKTIPVPDEKKDLTNVVKIDSQNGTASRTESADNKAST